MKDTSQKLKDSSITLSDKNVHFDSTVKDYTQTENNIKDVNYMNLEETFNVCFIVVPFINYFQVVLEKFNQEGSEE
jgi:hypothetical protein